MSDGVLSGLPAAALMRWCPLPGKGPICGDGLYVPAFPESDGGEPGHHARYPVPLAALETPILLIWDVQAGIQSICN